MKQTKILTILMVLTFILACNTNNESAKAEEYKKTKTAKEETQQKGDKNLVLVELFTSEG